MIKFSYVPDWPWLVGASILTAAVLLLFHWLAVGRPRWGLRVCLLGLRWLAIAAVAVCLLDPQRVDEVRRQQAAPVAVLLDASRSMSIPDLGEPRLDAAKSWLHQQLLPLWPAGIAQSFYLFSRALEPLSALDTASPTGGVTTLAASLEQLLALPREEPLAAVVVCSDGIDTAQGDPLSVARAYRRKGIPIHTATFGTRREPRDIVLENVQVKRAVPNQAPTKVALTLRSPGFAGQTVPVRIRYANQLLASHDVRLTGAEQRVEMDFTPHQKGFQTYEVLVPPQPGEWAAANNRRVFGLEVIDPTIRVIYMEGTPQQSDAPIPEWKYLKDALQSDPNIKVTVLYQLLTGAGAGGYQYTVDVDPQTGEKVYPVDHPTRGFPRTMAELLKHDVIIHSDIKGQFLSAEQLQNMARFVEQFGGGYVMVGGNSAFGKGGYQKTIIDRIIPVAMQQYADSIKLDFQMQVMVGALDHPLMAIGATREDTLRIWTQKLPRLHGFNRVDRAKPGAIVLGVTPGYSSLGTPTASAYGQRVVLAAQEIGAGRSMAFTSDTTRTWGEDFETRWGERINPALSLSEQNCDSRYYRAFWINAIRWLSAGKVGRTNNAVTLELSQSYSLPNQPTTASVKVRDLDGNDLAGADVSLVISVGSAVKSTNRIAFDAASLSYVAELRPVLAGNYTVAALATQQGRKLGEDQQLLMCEESDREMIEVRARPDLMAELARVSGGRDLTADLDPSPALAAVFQSVPPVTVNYRRTPLWDRGWWLAGIFGLLTFEWVLRRMKGMA
jgi:uncharacterized membrane protein